MKLILVQRNAAARAIELGKWSWALLSVCVLGIPLGMMGVGYEIGHKVGGDAAKEERLQAAEAEAGARAEELASLAASAERKLRAMTLSVAELQARMTRLDALGEHLTDLAGLDGGEFSFDNVPAMGGPIPEHLPMEESLSSVTLDGLQADISVASNMLDDREAQLDVLAQLLVDEQLDKEAKPSGRPITWGWLSSNFGTRTDPFSGKKAWHQGVDFAGREGSEIIAVASGVVSYSGVRSGYGTMVEVAHGDGLVTRYAHNQENLVKVGDLIRKGEAVALMGSSGRSTGPHVHFEVFKNGRPVDPASYVRRTHR